MAEAVGGKDTAATALTLFDRLRLREPLARAFSGGGDITEDGWRAAARVRLAFLVQTLTPAKPAKADEAFAGFPRGLWDDDDARWLLKVHESTRRVVLQQGAAPADAVVGAVARSTPARGPGRGGSGRRPASVPRSKPIEERVEDASEQAEEAGFRLGKKKEPVAEDRQA